MESSAHSPKVLCSGTSSFPAPSPPFPQVIVSTLSYHISGHMYILAMDRRVGGEYVLFYVLRSLFFSLKDESFPSDSVTLRLTPSSPLPPFSFPSSPSQLHPMSTYRHSVSPAISSSIAPFPWHSRELAKYVALSEAFLRHLQLGQCI